MAASAPQSNPVGPDTQIIVKVLFDGDNRRFKLPLRDLGPQVFPNKVRSIQELSDRDG
jgi:next-to-BRCA1 protein 1